METLDQQEEIRRNSLCEQVHRIFGTLDPDFEEAKARDAGQPFFTEMFEVIGIRNHHVELRYEFEDKIVYPVRFPDSILEFVRFGDVFLITLARKQNYWKPIFMIPYETADGPEDEVETKAKESADKLH
jgi:hypothetical protein